MTKEEKAKELGQMYFPDSDNIWARGNIEAHAVESACMDMAAFVEQQFEANRLSASERQTQEEAQRESDFVMGIIKKEYRQPTFSDAIEYGKNIVLTELERIIKEKEEAGKNYVFAFSEMQELVKKMSQKG